MIFHIALESASLARSNAECGSNYSGNMERYFGRRFECSQTCCRSIQLVYSKLWVVLFDSIGLLVVLGCLVCPGSSRNKTIEVNTLSYELCVSSCALAVLLPRGLDIDSNERIFMTVARPRRVKTAPEPPLHILGVPML